jgi:BASS family bile acid:Na+ symporter
MGVIKFIRNWTLPVAMSVGAGLYLIFAFTTALDKAGNAMEPVFDFLLPVSVFFTLFVTFCKVNFHNLHPYRWHVSVVIFQLLSVLVTTGIILTFANTGENKILWESVLICIIGPTAAAAPVVTQKLGGGLDSMTSYTLISSIVASISIPLVFPFIENSASVPFLSAFLVILKKLSLVLLLPLILGWTVRHHVPRLYAWIDARPNLGFYLWGFGLSITTGITVRNIVDSTATLGLLLFIAVMSLAICIIQFAVGRYLGHFFNARINSGQALGQKNTALAIWIATAYLNPVSAVGPGCYVLWQNIINSIQLWDDRRKKEAAGE